MARSDIVDGKLTLKNDHMHFLAHDKSLQFMVDYLDIVDCNKITLPNPATADHSDKLVRELYRHVYMLQIEVSAINGHTAV